MDNVIKSKDKEFEFRLAEIVTHSFSYTNISKKIKKSIQDNTIMKVNYGMNTNIKKNIVEFSLGFLINDKISEDELCKIEIGFIFNIVDLEKFIINDKFISNQIPIQLASISYSTFRGMVYEKLSGTSLNSLPPMPIINPIKLLSPEK
jgi:5-hydroxyisourate hydrolase-like protein (transthyretin family)